MISSCSPRTRYTQIHNVRILNCWGLIHASSCLHRVEVAWTLGFRKTFDSGFLIAWILRMRTSRIRRAYLRRFFVGWDGSPAAKGALPPDSVPAAPGPAGFPRCEARLKRSAPPRKPEAHRQPCHVLRTRKPCCFALECPLEHLLECPLECPLNVEQPIRTLKGVNPERPKPQSLHPESLDWKP